MTESSEGEIHVGSIEKLREYLATHPVPHDADYDGNSSFTLSKPRDAVVREFARSDVYYVNGVATPMVKHLDDANAFAAKIGHDVTLIQDGTAQDDPTQFAQRTPDLVKAVLEHQSATFAYAQKPEQAVAKAILSHVEVGKDGSLHILRDMHFAAHSRGAIITQRGIELADLTLAANGASADAIERLNGHISLET